MLKKQCLSTKPNIIRKAFKPAERLTMFHTLSGVLTHQQDNKIVITHGAVGFEIFCPQAKSLALQQNITLFIYMHWNAEQGPSLFGFQQAVEKDLFLMIISCSGIGPKLALTILESTAPSDFLQIICEENIKALSSIKGVGAKKAEQLIVQLKDKAHKLINEHPIAQNNTVIGAWVDLQQTLNSLNYSPTEIKQTTAILKQQTAGQSVPFDLLLRKALTLLAKK